MTRKGKIWTPCSHKQRDILLHYFVPLLQMKQVQNSFLQTSKTIIASIFQQHYFNHVRVTDYNNSFTNKICYVEIAF